MNEYELDENGNRTERIKKIDVEDLRDLVYSLISKLQREVYRDNKIALYNRDGIGLNFAYDEAESHDLLDKGDDAFYYNVFTRQERPFIADVE